MSEANEKNEKRNSMKIYHCPKVYVIAQTRMNLNEVESFLQRNEFNPYRTDGSPAESLAEVAGRNCYQSFNSPRPGGTKGYIGHILEVGHGSVLEHASWTFLVENISRSLSHELVRHRIASYSQLSQRYVDESVAEYVAPEVIAEIPELYEEWLDVVGLVHDFYVKLSSTLYDNILNEEYEIYEEEQKAKQNPVKWKGEWLRDLPREQRTAYRKRAREAARSVLPNATETKIVMTMNVRTLRHFLEMRASRHADVEIRKLGNAIYKIVVEDSPILFGDYKLEDLPDGTFEVITPYKKV